MIDAVLSYHLNPQTCGVAKWSAQLAARLGVPHGRLDALGYRHPLLSIKCSELVGPWHCRLPDTDFDLFLHDVPLTGRDHVWRARRVYAANAFIAQILREDVRVDIVEAFCPSTVNGNPSRGAYRVLVFGMAHKLLLPHFEALKQQLEIEHPDYTIELSTAVHEGSPWDEALTQSVDAMRGIFGDRLRVLGYLGDDALAKELREVDAVACYYVPALRANNTSYWAALEAGKTIYTNRDEYSPAPDLDAHSWEKLLEKIV